MPELPEVETIVRSLRDGHPRNIKNQKKLDDGPGLQIKEHPAMYQSDDEIQPSILGSTIAHAKLLWHRTLAEPSEPEFLSRVIGQSIEDISRRGKYLVFHLSEDKLLIHLRMSGDLFLEQEGDPIAPHHRLVISLESPEWEVPLRLSFNDTRKFGRVWLTSDAETVTGNLGPEPLSTEFTPYSFQEMLSKRNRMLKPLLLDQEFIAGLGNIYADEALHRAKLHPKTIARALSMDMVTGLWESIRYVLQEGIRHNGSSIDWMYRGGGYQKNFQVYGRAEEPCYRCGTPIRRIILGQRSTHYCPKCQPDTL